MLLTGLGHLSAVQSDDAVETVKKRCDLINNHLLRKARATSQLSYLASPLTGGGIHVGRFAQLFLLAKQQGHKQPADWAQFAWLVLCAQGERLVKEGKALESTEDNLTELTAQAQTFAVKQLPILKVLKIA